MNASTKPAFEADRHLERAEALITVIRTLSTNADGEDLQDIQPGLAIISEEISINIRKAREAIENA